MRPLGLSRWVSLLALGALGASYLLVIPPLAHPPELEPVSVTDLAHCWPAEEAPELATRLAAETLRRWLHAARTRSTDPLIEHHLRGQALELTAGSARALLEAWWASLSPPGLDRPRETVLVEDSRVALCPGAPPLWELRWAERVFDARGALAATHRLRAVVRLELVSPAPSPSESTPLPARVLELDWQPLEPAGTLSLTGRPQRLTRRHQEVDRP